MSTPAVAEAVGVSCVGLTVGVVLADAVGRVLRVPRWRVVDRCVVGDVAVTVDEPAVLPWCRGSAGGGLLVVVVDWVEGVGVGDAGGL